MKKVISLAILTVLLLNSCKNKSEKTKNSSKQNKEVLESKKTSHLFLDKKFIENHTYQIENEKISLKDGKFKRYSIINYNIGDVNKDGIEDLFILLYHNSQGSGSFYYTNLFIGKSNDELEFIEEKFIGDRINPIYITINQANQKHPHTNAEIDPSDFGTFSVGYYTYTDNQSFSEKPKLFIAPEWKMINGKVVKIKSK